MVGRWLSRLKAPDQLILKCPKTKILFPYLVALRLSSTLSVLMCNAFSLERTNDNFPDTEIQYFIETLITLEIALQTHLCSLEIDLNEPNVNDAD